MKLAAYEEQLREPFESSLEFNETTSGEARRGTRGWSATGKVIVFGIIKRNDQLGSQADFRAQPC